MAVNAFLADLVDFTGTLFLVRVLWFWMAVSLGLGVWVGWRTAGEEPAALPPDGET